MTIQWTRVRWLAIPLLSTLLPCSASSAETASQSPINIGFVSELSGNWSFYGNTCLDGAKLAEQDMGTEGALGRPLKLRVIDNQSNPAQSVAAVRRLDTEDKIVALTGTTSSDNALAMYGYAEENKLPFLVPVAAFPQLTKPGTQYTFRMEPDAVGVGYAVAKYIEHVKPGASVALMYSDFAYYRAIFGGLKYQAAHSNLHIVADIVFPQGSADATIQAAQVVAAKPDFIVPYAAGAFDLTVANQLFDLGIKPSQLIHPSSSAPLINGWGKRNVGSVYGTFFDYNLDNLTPRGLKFVKDFIAEFKRPPTFSEAFCYTAPFMLQTVIKNAGTTDREKVRDALRTLKFPDLLTTETTQFDSTGAAHEWIYFMQIDSLAGKDLEYKAHKVFDLQWNADVIPVYDLVK